MDARILRVADDRFAVPVESTARGQALAAELAKLDGCIDAARDMTCGGARYNFSSISARGVGTAGRWRAAGPPPYGVPADAT